jgi:hypothetical protein
MSTVNSLHGQEMWEAVAFQTSVDSLFTRDAQQQEEVGTNFLLKLVAAIQQSHALAHRSLRRSAIISPRAAFANYWAGLIETHKLMAAFGNSTPSYMRPPPLFFWTSSVSW